MRIGDQLGRQKRPRVVVRRIAQHLARRAGLDDLAEIHDDHPVGNGIDDIEIVADQDQAEVAAGFQAYQQVEDLGLDRHIEARQRLVGDDQPGTHRHGPGDRDALLLAAGQLMRIAVVKLGGVEADGGQQFGYLGGQRVARGQPVAQQDIRQGRVDAHPRIERRCRVLEDRLNRFSKSRPIGRREPNHGLAIIGDLARGRLDETQQHAGERALAGAGFAHDRQRLAFVDVEIDRVDRAPGVAGAAEPASSAKALDEGARRKDRDAHGVAALPSAFV